MARILYAIGACSLLPTASGLQGTVNRAGWLESPNPVDGRRLDDDAPNPYTCNDGVNAAEEKWHVTGTNLGGWLVLEPWITPSLFYQFLSSDDKWGTDAPAHTAMDSYSFCTALGSEEANKQLRRHWKAWLREEDIASIAKSGATHVRIPIGDWMYAPYEPYIGCMDGARDELQRALDLCHKYKLKVRTHSPLSVLSATGGPGGG
jgi:glucan 1,3-beta-glucosidase